MNWAGWPPDWANNRVEGRGVRVEERRAKRSPVKKRPRATAPADPVPLLNALLNGATTL